MLSLTNRSRIQAAGIAVLILIAGGVEMASQIIAAVNQKVSDVVGQNGMVRWTDEKYIHVNADGSVAVDKNAPVSQWPKAVRLYYAPDELPTEPYGLVRIEPDARLQVTLFRSGSDPTRFPRSEVR